MSYEDAGTLPTQLPEKGFYYHYKHDPTGLVNNYAYEVIGVGHHTEDDCRPEDQFLMVYRPLYDAFVFKLGKLFAIRPLAMWMGTVQKDGESMPRFTRITDTKTINELTVIRNKMYGELTP